MGQRDLGEWVRELFLEGRTGLALTGENQGLGRDLEELLRAAATSSGVDPRTLSEQFSDHMIPPEPTEQGTYLRFLLEEVLPHTIRVQSPKFVGHMTAGLPAFVHPIGAILTALNQNVVKVETSGILTLMERQALGMLHWLTFGESAQFYAEHIQNTQSTLGMVVSGGTLANIAALWCARNAVLGPRGDYPGVDTAGIAATLEHYGYCRAVIVGSSLMHYSLEKAADVLGIGTDGLVHVPADVDGRVPVDRVRQQLVECQERKECVIALVGIAGTTETGVVDDLEGLAAVAQELSVYYHVDAAWGGPVLFSRTHRSNLKGIEKADSVTIDGHKQLYLPLGIGMVMLRDPTTATGIEKVANYIIRAESLDLGKRALEGSRPGMALFLHAGLSVLGQAGYERLIDLGIENTHHLASVLRDNEAWELVSEPQLNIVVFRFVPSSLRRAVAAGSLTAEDQRRLNALNRTIQSRQAASGGSFVSRTTLTNTKYGDEQPVAVLRSVLANPLTNQSDIDAAVAELRAIGAQCDAEAST